MSADRSDAAATPALISQADLPGQAELDRQLAALVALCSGQPVHLPQVDLIEVANSHWSELDATQDPADIFFPLLALHWYVDHVGVLRSTKGDRAVGIANELRRYVLPFLLELAMTSGGLPAAEFRVLHVKGLQKILAGADALPAATVAGDQLDRRGVTCVWLTLPEAADVCTVSLRHLQAAAVNGQLPRAVQQHDGQWLVASLGLREAGWLREPDEPHGLAKGTAGNTLRVLGAIADYANSLGADLRGNFGSKALAGLTPLAANRQRTPSPARAPYLSLALCWRLAGQLHPTHQLVLWLQRLVGLRISEALGLMVGSFLDGTHPCLTVERQGGTRCIVRDDDGRLVAADGKDHVKTELSERVLPLPAPVAALIRWIIRSYHTDLVTGEVLLDARLVPGLQQEDISGSSAYRAALDKALMSMGLEPSAGGSSTGADGDPHDLRASVITDLIAAETNGHKRRGYFGHEDPAVPMDVHEKAYNRGIQDPEQLRPIADAIEELIAAPDGPGQDLRAPTNKIEGWGRGTRRGQFKQQILLRLNDDGWRVGRAGGSARRTPHRSALSLALAAACDPAGAAAASVDAGTGSAGLEMVRLSAAQIALRYGHDETNIRRKMADGTIATTVVLQGSRQLVRVATPAAVEAALNRTGTSIEQVATQVGWSTHQVWTLLRKAGELDGHPVGRPIVLSDRQAQFVVDEVASRLARGTVAVTVKEAALQLGLEILTVETLIRRGTLALATTTDGTRRRYVCLRSIDAFLSAYPPAPAVSLDAELVPRAQARQLLGEDRNGIAYLVTSRQLIACTRDRKQCITLDSLLALAEARGLLDEVLARLAG